MDFEIIENILNLNVNLEEKTLEINIEKTTQDLDLSVTTYDDTEIRKDIDILKIDTNNLKNITENLENKKANKTTVENMQTEINSLNLLIDDIDKDVSNLDNKVIKNTEDILEQEETLNHLADIKADKTEIPDVSKFITKNVNDLINYYKKSETYTQSEINSLIGTIKTVSLKVVPEKPVIGQANIIYLVPSKKQTTGNIYEEWIYVDNKWEMIGSTQADLSNYYTIQQINTILYDYITSTDLEIALYDYVLKETGKGLSTNDYTNEDKQKLDNSAPQSEITRLDEKINEIELFKFPNVIIHGTPTINNGQVSDFSTENYLSFPAVFNLHDRGFEFNLAFRTGDDVSTAQNILGSRFCMALFIQNSKINLRVSQNGTSWDLVDIQGNINIQPNTTYYIQIYFDKLTYKLKYSLDGIEYTDIASKVASVSPYPSQIYLGIGNNFFNPFKGIINLNKCNLKVNKSIIWQGMDDAGLATRMATDMENIDEAGIEKINLLVANNLDKNINEFSTDNQAPSAKGTYEKFKELRTDLGIFNNVTENLHNEIANTIESGRFLGNVGEIISTGAGTTWTRYYSDINQGYTCNIKYRVAVGYNNIFFVDKDDKILQIADIDETYTTGQIVERTYVAPIGTKRIYINNYTRLSDYNTNPNTNFGLTITYKEVAKETLDKLKALFGRFKPLDLSIYSSNEGLFPQGTDEYPSIEDGAYQVVGKGKINFGNDELYDFANGDIVYVSEEATVLTFISGIWGAGYFSYNSSQDAYEGGYYTTISDVDYEIQLLTQKQVNVRTSRLGTLTVQENYEYRCTYSAGSTAVKLTPSADMKDLSNNARASFNIWFNTHATTACTWSWNDTSTVKYIINGSYSETFTPNLNKRYYIDASWKGTFWLFMIYEMEV